MFSIFRAILEEHGADSGLALTISRIYEVFESYQFEFFCLEKHLLVQLNLNYHSI